MSHRRVDTTNEGTRGRLFARTAMLGLYVLAVPAPLVALVVSAVTTTGARTQLLPPLLPSERTLGLFLDSLALATAVAAATTVVGGTAAARISLWHQGRTRHLRWLVLLSLVVPPYVHASAWMASRRMVAGVAGTAGITSLALPGWAWAFCVEFMALLPLGVGFALVGFASVDPSLVSMARVFREDGSVLRRIVLPLAKPSLLAGAAFVFLFSVMDYTVPYLFQMNVYPLEVYAEYSASVHPQGPLVLSLPLMAVAVLLVLVFQNGLRRTVAGRRAWRTPTWRPPPSWPRWLRAVQVLACAVLGGVTLVPLVFLTAQAVGEGTAGSTATGEEIILSFGSAALAALLCLPLAYTVAVRMNGTGRVAQGWWILNILPLAIPAPLVGVGLVELWNHPWLAVVYDSRLMITLASLARFTPLAAIVVLVQLRRLDPRLLDAARVFQTSPFRLWTRIRLPLLAPGLLAAACLTFTLALGELPATLIVAPPGEATLTMRAFNLMHYGAAAEAAALSLLVLALTLGAALLAAVALSRWERFCGAVGDGPEPGGGRRT